MGSRLAVVATIYVARFLTQYPLSYRHITNCMLTTVIKATVEHGLNYSRPNSG